VVTAAAKGAGWQTIPALPLTRPVPSLLTTARQIPAKPIEHVDLGAGQDLQIPYNWRSGVQWRSPAGHKGERQTWCSSSITFATAAAITQPAFYPYIIDVPYSCDWVYEDADYRQDAVDQLDAVTPWHVSNELWTGTAEPLNKNLQTSATDVSAASAVHPVTALGTLLEAYSDCSQAGGAVIHCPLSTIVSLLHAGLVKQQGDLYFGPGGCLVSSGPGYPTAATGTGPGGANAGTGNVWMYITGPIEYALGDIEITPDGGEAHYDQRRNRYEVVAQRLAIHRFDPVCVYACKTFTPSPGQGYEP